MKKILVILLTLLGLGQKPALKIAPTLSPTATITPSPTITLTPTPKPLTFEEMNQLYGPCAKVSVLMYHHVKNFEEAKANKKDKLTVSPEMFRKQLEYLRDRGYRVAGINELVNFFESDGELLSKTVLLSFDDAYEDVYSVAWPILKEFGYTAVVFTPTGLVENPNYLSWQKILEMGNGGIYFGNHTWSHQGSGGSGEKLTKEIETAGIQLSERGLDSLKIFAYPYGTTNMTEKQILENKGYRLAFTTKRGNILCQKQRFQLPRIRVGNSQLSDYGL